MLLGVAQVVVNVADIDARSAELRSVGFSESFMARDIPSHPAKRPLQANERERLDMAHFAAPNGGMAVELTAHAGEPPAGRAAFELSLPDKRLERTRVSVPAADVERSLCFWRDSLGFRETDSSEVLELRAIRPEWSLEVELLDGPPAEATSVDAGGCVLVTMLTTALPADLERLRSDGLVLRSAPPWEESIDGRLLRVAMAEGPSGELIELLQPPRQTQPIQSKAEPHD